MPVEPLRVWDRKNKKPGETVTIDKSAVKLVRQRWWNTEKSKKIEGCVVEMRDGHSPKEYGLVNVASEARRALGIIEASPAGSAPLNTSKH